MKTKKNRHYEEVGYWESMADILVGLLLSVLLIVMLLILYLMRIPDEQYVDNQYGDNEASHYGWYNDEDNDEEADDHHEDYPYVPDNDSGGGGGGGEPHETVTPQPTVSPQPTLGVEEGIDKAAIFVQIVDGETQSTIKRSGVEYELYAYDDALQTLSIYYPVNTDYVSYETTKDGVFFLPEKIVLGDYYLHGLTTVPGYDVTERTDFSVDEPHDWDEPFVVTVELYPSRSIIRVQMKDRESGRKLGGGAFNVIAVTDVVTLDGTTRYHAGEIVDTIVLDESGYGESELLYLGQFRLVQTTVPEFYASIEETPVVTVQKSSQGGKPGLTEVSAQRTTVRVYVSDALYPGKGLAGVAFTLTSGGTSRRVVTDEDGWIVLNELRAGTTYHLRQTSALKDYTKDPTDYQFYVDSTGRIDGEAEKEITLSNAIVRISIGVKGKLFGGLVSDENVALYTADGTLVKSWNSSALEEEIEGLEPGEYRIVLRGNMDGATPIVVRQTENMQEFIIQIWTTNDIGTLVIVGILGVGLIALAVILISRKRRNS